MTAKTTRILKEARPVVGPWCAVTFAGVLPLVHPLHSIASNMIEVICFVGFFFGIPLLATLALGNEFQHRTLDFLLTQPIDRMEIWTEKFSITVVAIFSVALVFFFDWRIGAVQLNPHFAEFAGAWIITTVASATFLTLVARSTLGSIALNYFNLFIILIWTFLPEKTRRAEHLSTATIAVASISLLCYAGTMLWLGRRTLARFQARGGMGGNDLLSDDLLMAGPKVLPGALAGWLRCRSTSAILNLIRKEIRLLRPLWLITVVAVLVWTCLALLGLAPVKESDGNPHVAMVMVGITSLLIAILAGSLSLGEERTSGTHSWHMTLPVPVRRQWLIKLLITLLAGSVCAVLLPALVMIAAGLRNGSPMMFVNLPDVMIWLLAALLLSFASFWCACAVNGTVRAVLWILPVMYALFLAVQSGGWAGANLMDRVLARFDLFANFKFTSAISNMQFARGLIPIRYLQMYSADAVLFLVAMLWLAGTLIFAVIKSYRLFRTQPQDSARSVVRHLLPVAISVLLCFFSLSASALVVDHAQLQMWTFFQETHNAIEKLESSDGKLDAAHSLQLTVDDLAKASPLSERTQRWLANSRITVTPDDDHLCRKGSYFLQDTDSCYLATIHLPSGSQCTMPFQPGRNGRFWFFGVCK